MCLLSRWDQNKSFYSDILGASFVIYLSWCIQNFSMALGGLAALMSCKTTRSRAGSLLQYGQIHCAAKISHSIDIVAVLMNHNALALLLLYTKGQWGQNFAHRRHVQVTVMHCMDLVCKGFPAWKIVMHFPLLTPSILSWENTVSILVWLQSLEKAVFSLKVIRRRITLMGTEEKQTRQIYPKLICSTAIIKLHFVCLYILYI